MATSALAHDNETVLLVDNFDSFTYNLKQAFQMLGEKVHMLRNTASLESCLELKPKAIVIGPGPGSPKEAGISAKLIAYGLGKIPLLGICLGHQCLAAVCGGTVRKAREPMHGKVSAISHNSKGLFEGLASPCFATRYHSLVVDKATLPNCLEAIAHAEDGEIMALQHRKALAFGVQFHPESVATREGLTILKNFIEGVPCL